MTASSTRRTTAAQSRIAAVGAIAVAGALLLTGCGDQTKDKEGGSGTATSSAAPLATSCPRTSSDKGVIKVGSDIAYAPVEFKDDSGKTVGIDPDLADAMGKQLGVKFEFENGTFDTLLTGLRSKRYDIAMSAMTDTKDRQEGIDAETGKKVGEGVDFVDYFTAGVSIYTQKGDDQGIKTWDDLCGKKVVVQRDTVSKTWPRPRPRSARPARSSPSRRSTTTSRPRPGCAPAARTPAPRTPRSPRTRRRPRAAARTSRSSASRSRPPRTASRSPSRTPSCGDALKAALNAIIKNGEYDKIIAKWGVEAGAVKEATINGGK